jgi:DNA-binding NarL/FixJ family response regulator
VELSSEEGIASLTSRERDIVIALVRYDGANGRALAARLGMSEQTLRNHFSSIYRKLGIPNRSGLVAFATRLSLDNAA